MEKRKKEILTTIRTIVEEIEGTRFNDTDAWKKMLDRLKTLTAHLPSDIPELLKVLGLCDEGLMHLSETSTKGSLSLVEAITEGLVAAEDYLTGGSNGKRFLQKAGDTLEEEMIPLRKKDQGNGGSGSDQGERQSSESPVAVSVHEAASLMVQVEPDDVDGMKRLAVIFEALEQNDGYPESARAAFGDISKRIQTIVTGDIQDNDAAMAEISKLMETAMGRLSEPDGDPLETEAGASVTAEEPAADGAASVDKKREPAPETHEETSVEIHEFDALPEDADRDLLAEFITESTDLIEAAEEALLALETDPEDSDAVGTVFRAFHTVKGVSAFLELAAISELAHHAESLLSRVRDKEIRYSGGYADLALRSLDMIKHMIQLVQGALEGEALHRPDGYEDLMQVLANPEQAGVSDESDTADASVASPRVGDYLVAQGKAERGKVEVAASSEGEAPIGVKMIKSKAAKVEDVAQALRTQRAIQGKHTADSSVRVSTGRLDRLVDMVGELVIAHSMVAQDGAVVASDNYELMKKMTQTSKIVRELQTLGMSMRMIPLKGTFTKMTRLVRDISRKVGKNVRLETVGEDTEIDRNMVDVINDPLMHMVRNSVDHGIESPEERVKAGKPEQGTVRLSAYHAAGSVVVEIEDDGKGLDADSILSKAREKGLVGKDASLSDREIYNLIFEPGFSTAKTVTDVSGRGVGMDVVKKNIDSLRGQVEIESKKGKGGIFRMSLPLTLAIIDGMVVRVGDETYIIPTGSIVRSVKPDEDEISTVLNRGEMMSLQGNLVPVFRLDSLFNISVNNGDQGTHLVVVVEDDKRKQAGLVIDDLVGRQQIVIKSLGEGMKDIPGISGGAIMPNGQVGLILDVGGVVKLANSTGENGSKWGV